MPLFSYNGSAFKFYLVNLPDDVNQEITKMIVENGGQISSIGDPPIINFTVPENYVPGKVMYDVKFIKDSVSLGELGDLYNYKLGPREAYDGCIMSIFMYEVPSCIYRYVNNPCLQKSICSFCGSRNVSLVGLDANDTSVASQQYSGVNKVITSEKSHNKGGGDAIKRLESTNEKHVGHLEVETEISPKLKKVQTNGHASSHEVSSVYAIAQDMINYSVQSNLSVTQVTQNTIDEIHSDTESKASIIIIKEVKETDRLDSESQRSRTAVVNHVKRESHLSSPEIIYTPPDREPEESCDREKKKSESRSRVQYKISHVPDVMFIKVSNASDKEQESHVKDNKNKNKAENNGWIASKLRRQVKEEKQFAEYSNSNCDRNVLISRKRNVMAEKIYEQSEKIEEQSEKSKSRMRIDPNHKNDEHKIDDSNRNGKKSTKRKLYDSPKVKNPLCSRKNRSLIGDLNKSDDEISIIRIPPKITKGKSKLPTCNASFVDGNANSKSNEDIQSNEDSTGSLTDPEGIFTNVVNNHTTRVLRRLSQKPNVSYKISDDDSSDSDVNEIARRKNDKKILKEDREYDDCSVQTVSSSEDSMDSERRPTCSTRNRSRPQLDINHEKDGKPVSTNKNLAEWLEQAKHKVGLMKAPQTRNFAKWEKWRMVVFLIEENLIEHAKGLDVWQYMLQRMDCGQRTKMSLNNHFLKFILPRIEEFRLPKDIESRFLTLRKGH